MRSHVRRLLLLVAFGVTPWLSGCDLLGITTPQDVAAAREADGKAIGGACRHAGRAIEDCYQLNRRADRAAVFTGWREMNDYMRENQIEEVKPLLPPARPPGAASSQDATGEGHARGG